MLELGQAVKGEIALIFAMTENRVIGRDNRLLWKLPEDMKHFRRVTRGNPVIMGRKTFESMGSKPLPGRRNIVMTRDPEFTAEGVEIARSVDEALNLALGAERICVIGGSAIYEAFLQVADVMYVTVIQHTFEGDSFFPEWKEDEWRLAQEAEGPLNTANPYLYRFQEYRRKK